MTAPATPEGRDYVFWMDIIIPIIGIIGFMLAGNFSAAFCIIGGWCSGFYVGFKRKTP